MNLIDKFGTTISREQAIESIGSPFTAGDAVQRYVEKLPSTFRNPARTMELAERSALRQWQQRISNPRNKVRASQKAAYIKARIDDYYAHQA